MLDPTAPEIVSEALALRASHPHAPAADVLDLVMKGRMPWLEDFFEFMVPPAPFALPVAEAVGDVSPAAEWRALTSPAADERVRDAMQRMYVETVRARFVRRYGLSWPPQPFDGSAVRLGKWLL
jgi:hypothetical protein